MSGAREQTVARLRRERPRDRFARATAWSLALAGAGAWLSGVLRPGELFEARRLANLERFLTRDLPPAPLRAPSPADPAAPASWSEWTRGLLDGRGVAGVLDAAGTTLWIAVLAIVLAAAAGALAAPAGARTLARSDPWGRRDARHDPLAWALRGASTAVRAGFVLARAVPEYVLAFLGLAIFGFTVWPLVLALALHNAGILGRLGAETLENLDDGPLRQLRRTGARRTQILFTGALPAAAPSYLLYVFYRFETCVREATVLGMLGVASLGYWISEMRTRAFYDELLVLVLACVALVLAADAASTAARAWVRRG